MASMSSIDQLTELIKEMEAIQPNIKDILLWRELALKYARAHLDVVIQASVGLGHIAAQIEEFNGLMNQDDSDES